MQNHSKKYRNIKKRLISLKKRKREKIYSYAQTFQNTSVL